MANFKTKIEIYLINLEKNIFTIYKKEKKCILGRKKISNNTNNKLQCFLVANVGNYETLY